MEELKRDISQEFKGDISQELLGFYNEIYHFRLRTRHMKKNKLYKETLKAFQ
jgi:hypothetical protein